MTAARTIRIASWNLWWRLGPWQVRQPAIAETLVGLGGDVVALQEVWATTEQRQIDQLATVTGLAHVAWAEFTDSSRWQRRIHEPDVRIGVGIISRWPIVHEEVVSLPLGAGPDEGRVALGVVIEHPHGLLPMVTAHLHSHVARSSTRVEQVRTLAQVVADLTERATRLTGQGSVLPAVLGGDFNAEPGSDEMRLLAGVLTDPVVELQALTDAWRLAPDDDPGWTWRRENPHLSVGNPNARIDYLYCGLDSTGTLARIVDVGLFGVGPGSTGVWPSDHAGIRLDLEPPRQSS